MKKNTILLFLSIIMMPCTVMAQGTDNEIETGFGGRLSLQIDRKIKKGLHVILDAQARTSDNTSSIGRYDAGIGISYKLNGWLKAQAGYTLIEAMNSSDEWKPRHRLYVDLTGTVKEGDWRFSLKEKLQLTHRSGINTFQTTPNSLSLKSRIKAEYKGFERIDPYVFAEVRLALNDPSCSAQWDGSAYSDYSFDGYTDLYLNRLRGAIGAEWKLNKSNALDLTIMLDYCHDKKIDTNSEGTKLKSLTYDRTISPQLVIGYKYSF